MKKMLWDEYYEKFYDWVPSTQVSRLSTLASYGPSEEITEVAAGLEDQKAAIRLVNRALDAGVQFDGDNLEELCGCVDEKTLYRVADTLQGPFTDEQLQDWAEFLDDDLFLDLVKRTGSAQHSPDAIVEISSTMGDDLIEEMALKANGCFSVEQLANLRDRFDESTLESLIQNALKNGVRFPPTEVVEWSSFGIREELIEKMAMTVDGRFGKEQAEELFCDLSLDVYRKIARQHHLDLHEEAMEEPQAKHRSRLGFFGTLLAAMTGWSLATNRGQRHGGRCSGDCANCPPHYGYRYGRWYYGHNHVHGCEFGGNKGSGSAD